MEKINFSNHGQRIDGTLFIPNKPKKQNPGVLFLHGMTSSEKNYLEIASKISELGIIGLTISLRAHGSSEGDFGKLRLNDGLSDTIAAYDFLASNKMIDPKSIGICGGSLGGALAVMASAKRNVKSVALRAPATYTKKMMGSIYKDVMDREADIFKKIQNPEDTPAIQSINNFAGSLLIVTAENDQIIPGSIPKLYFNNAKLASKKKLEVIKNSNHQMMDPKPREQFVALVTKWFIKTL